MKSFTFQTLLLFILATTSVATAAPTKLSPEEAKQLAIEAYIYGYPLVTME